MPLPSPIAALLTLLAAGTLLPAQTPIGTINAASATVSGIVTLNDGRASVGGNAIITARDHTATLQLARGGEILVCATSALHAAQGASPVAPSPLLLALDRGAVEIHMLATGRDAILTPDLRFTLTSSPGHPAAGLLDLRVRVTGNGDTCVDNRGAAAPTLEVSDQFGSGQYLVKAGQHLLFEHGSLQEVVDRETSPCGCPAPPVLSAANNGISVDPTHAALPGARVADDPDEVAPHTRAEAQHPFPTAESQGLTPNTNSAASVPQAPPGEPHAQVAASLAFGPNATPPPASTQPASERPSSATAATTASASVTPNTATAAAPAGTPGPAAAASPAPSPKPSPASSASAAPVPPPTPSQRAEPLASAAPSPGTDDLNSHEIAQAPLQPAAPAPRTVFHRIGHFFRHLFTGDR